MSAVLVILLNGLWQGAAIAAITWCALRLSPRVNASTRYAAWTLALIATVVVPVLTSLGRISYETPSHATTLTAHASSPSSLSRERAPSASRGSRSGASPSAIVLPHAPSVRVDPPRMLTQILFALWGIAAFALIVRLAVALLQLEKLKRDSLPLGMQYRDMLQQWQQHSGHSRDVRICTTDGIEVPVAVGLFDAMVLLPTHLLQTLDASEIDQISLHELGHLLRHDDWSNGFQRVVTALLFFNPAVWFIARQMDIEREVACDDFVLELTGAVRNYAYCLTKMAEMTAWPHQPLAAPGVFITRKNISIRIERLLRTGRAISSSISPATAATVVVGLAAVYLFARVFTPAVAFALPEAKATPSPTVAAASASPAVSPVPERRPRVFPSPRRVAVTVPAIDVPAVDVNVPAIHVQVPRIHIASQRVVAEVSPAGNCTGCDFANANLAGKDFSHQNMTGANFEDAKLRGARFEHSNLSGANFEHADLRDASFVGANLTGCNLEGAELSGATFDGANLSGCSLSMRHLTPSQTHVFLMKCTGCDFSGADLSGQDLRGIKVTGIDLSGANLRRVDLSGATLSGIDFSNADLTGANLNGTTFSGCSFDGADLRHVDLTHTNFVGSSLSDARMN